MIKVWDPAIRVFHWALVAAFALAWLTGDEDSTLHQWLGYAIAGLLAFRLVWGLIGPHYARFAQFLTGPSKLMQYLRAMPIGREPRYIGHNPAGAAMTAAIVLTLSATAFTGWLMAEPQRLAMLPDLPAFVAPAYADSDDDRSDGKGRDGALKGVHEALANLMLLLAALHVGGVTLASRRHHENLARAMITGEKRAPGPADIA
jgi:cytochrome b